jgi:mycothiol synthase
MVPGVIRPLGPGDYRAAVALFAAAYPGRAGETVDWRDAETAGSSRRFVAAAGSPPRVAGYGAIWHVRPGKFRMDLVVSPGWRRCGIGGWLLAHLGDQARIAGAATLQARVEDDGGGSLAFLAARGFAETMRMRRQVLDVAGARLAAHAALAERLACRGIVIGALEDELDRVAVFWEGFCDLFNAAREGWPDPDPGPVEALTPHEFRHRHRTYEADAGAGADRGFLARREDLYLGFTSALGTAVRPAFRGQGIATALKVRAITDARDRGVATLRTSTGNPAMLRVNHRLGFRTTSTEIRLIRRLLRLACTWVAARRLIRSYGWF